MKFIRLKKKLYNQLCFLLAHTCNIFFIICALVYVNTKASRISMHDFYRRLKIIVALEKPIIFTERTLPVLTRHKNGRPRVLLVGWTVVLPSMFFICLITGRNMIDKFWYTARQINELLTMWLSGDLSKSDSMPGSDLFRLMHKSMASFHCLLSCSVTFDPSTRNHVPYDDIYYKYH